MEPRRSFLKSSAALAASAALGGERGAAQAKGPVLPTVRLGKHEVTRLLLGSNPFNGYSHFNRLLDRHMVEWSTSENVCRCLSDAERYGINTWQFSDTGRRHLPDLQRHWAAGGKLQWIYVTSREMEAKPELVREAAKLKPIGIVHHGGSTDQRFSAGRAREVREFLKVVRDAGVLAGVSTHRPEVIEQIEEENWDVDFYMACFYQVNRRTEELVQLLGQRPLGEVFLPGDPVRMCQTIRRTKKTCLAFKVLGAGRVTDSPQGIDQAFRFAFQNIKPQDGIIVGMYPRYTDQIRENCEGVRRILAGA